MLILQLSKILKQLTILLNRSETSDLLIFFPVVLFCYCFLPIALHESGTRKLLFVYILRYSYCSHDILYYCALLPQNSVYTQNGRLDGTCIPKYKSEGLDGLYVHSFQPQS